MSRKSVHVVICLAAVMLAFAVSESYASPARMAGLNMSGYNAMFTRDYVNTYPFPVAINRYPNLVWADLGYRQSSTYDAGDRAMGLFHEIGDNAHYGVLGITLRENSPQDPILWSLGLDGASHQQFDILWGRDFEQASVGLRFDLARSSYDDKDSGNTLAPLELEGNWVNTWGAAGSVDYDLTEDAMLEVGGEVRQYTYKDDWDGITDDGSMSFRLAGRVFYERAENKTMVPVVTFTRSKLAVEGGSEASTKLDDFMVGVACNHMVNSSDLLIYGAAFRNRSWDSSDENGSVVRDYSRRDLPLLFCSLEHRFRDWLVGRGGASQAMVARDYGEEDTSDYANGNTLESEFDFALGIGLEFTNFTIDATLNQNYPFTGFYFVSGQTTNNLFGQVSFTYTY